MTKTSTPIAATAKTAVKRLALAERGTGVADQPQGEQSAEQPDRRAGIELTDRDDLGHDIKGQPGHGHRGPEQPQSQR